MDSLLHEGTIESLLAVARSAPPGDFAEFGVYKGGCAERIADLAREQGRALYLFDTFTGIPVKDEIDTHRIGDFNDTSVDAVRAGIPDAIIVQGVFPGTLEGMKFPRPLAFIHVDADQYASVKAAIEHFPPLMCSGGAMIFDDYKCLEGATLAFEEWGQPFTLTAQGKPVWRKP